MPKRLLTPLRTLFGLDQSALIQNDESTRFLPFIVGVMIFLTALALGTTFTISATIKSWETALSGTLTVQVIPDMGDDEAKTDKVVTAVLHALEENDAIVQVSVLGEDETLELLDTWVGDRATPEDLPLPIILDVSVDVSKGLNLEDLRWDLSKLSSNIVVDDHQVWLEKLISFVNSFRVAALIAVTLVFFAGIAVVVLATKTSLAVHLSVVEILHLSGAKDLFIARQLAKKSFMVSFLGGAIGLAVGVLVMLAIGVASQNIGGLQPTFDFSAVQMGVLALLPLMGAVVAMIVAVWTVTTTLRRMI